MEKPNPEFEAETAAIRLFLENNPLDQEELIGLESSLPPEQFARAKVILACQLAINGELDTSIADLMTQENIAISQVSSLKQIETMSPLDKVAIFAVFTSKPEEMIGEALPQNEFQANLHIAAIIDEIRKNIKPQS
ncbi:MAG: hypothetical protein JNK26_02995 [Candidatus Doudnabacteria bacterium]|nr:hypothetical protein [Candidatus Doudnabacteria bacterium]